MGNELYREYFDAIYKASNDLSLERFDKAAEGFMASYSHLLPEDRHARILDVGCGAGYFLYFLQKVGYVNFLGIDISPQQVDFCRSCVSSCVQEADAFEFLEGKDSSFDLILAHDVLEHVPKDRLLIFCRKLFRALKPGGVLIVRVPNMSNPLAAHGRYIDLTHEVGFTERSLHQLLFMGGFRDITLQGALVVRTKGWRGYLRKAFLKAYYAWVRFLYYVQDFSVPTILDHDLVAVGRKVGDG